MTAETSGPGPDTVDRLAVLLDGDGRFTLDVVRADSPGWLVWHSRGSGCYHARRDDDTGHYQNGPGDPRRFAVAAATLGRLAVLLLAQTALDGADT